LQKETEAEYVYRKFQDDDESALRELLRNTFPKFKENSIWVWKYKLNPSFDNSLVSLATKDGELVGSNYWMLRDLKILDNLQVKAALGADVAVNSNHRGSGVGKGLVRYPRTSGVFKEKNVLLSYMFGRPELSTRFYKPAAGYIIAPNQTITYRKLFNCRQLRERFEEINRAVNSNVGLKPSLKELTMCISFNLRGAPWFSVTVEPDKVYLEEGKAENCDMLIEGNLPLSMLTIGGTVGLGNLVKLLLTGKLKIKKGVFQVFKLRKILVLFQTALSQKE
jgi:predicted N-acetyltransferase YhbS